jgi:hypothetical protein
MKKYSLDEDIPGRLAQHAERAGFGKVMTVDNNDALGYLLYHDYNMRQEPREYLREEIDARNRGKTPLRPSFSEMGLFTKAGVFIPADELQSYGVTHSEFLKYFGVDINKGLALVNGTIPEEQDRLFIQIHETVHARDYANGFRHLERETPKRQAYEALTDTRALCFGILIMDDSTFDFSGGFEKSKIRSSYIALNYSNVRALRNATTGLDPRTDMVEILNRLKEHVDWTHGRGIQDLLLKAPAYQIHTSKDLRRQSVLSVLENLITLEEASQLEPVVPREM